MGFDGWAQPLRLRMLLAGMLVLLIAGCSATGGGDDPSPTATATVWPTVGDEIDASTPAASPPWQMSESPSAATPTQSPAAQAASPGSRQTLPGGTSSPPAASSPVSVVAIVTIPGEGTQIAAATEQSATQIATADDALTSPTQGAATPNASGASDPPAVVQAANSETGDGTSGPPPVADLGERTPEPADTNASPSASPQASPGARVIVTSCSPAEVPPVEGNSESYITTSDVNIRIGPGTDCDLAADILPQGTLLTLTSGSVVREGEDGTEWVRVDVDGFEGWVSTEFITPDSQ